MKAPQQPFISKPAIRFTILKLAFVGGMVLTCAYGVLKLLSSAISVLQ
jgi:hypothetical protein